MADERPTLTKQQIEEGWRVEQLGGMWLKVHPGAADRPERTKSFYMVLTDDAYDGTNGDEFIAKVRDELQTYQNTVLSRGAGLALLHELEKANAETAAQRARAGQEEVDRSRLYSHFQALVSKINRIRAALCAARPSIDAIRAIVDE